MELARYLLLRFLTEVWGFRLDSESGDLISLYDGNNRVLVKTFFTDIYDEVEIYKKINELTQQDYDKAFIAVLASALFLIDPKHLRSLGIGLISVDPSKGLEGVEVKLPARPRARPIQQRLDTAEVLDMINKVLKDTIDRELKRVEAELYNRIKEYIDRRLESLKQPATPPQQPEKPTGQQPILDNEWVKILRKRGAQ